VYQDRGRVSYIHQTEEQRATDNYIHQYRVADSYIHKIRGTESYIYQDRDIDCYIRIEDQIAKSI
jgi:hypothetical protein